MQTEKGFTLLELMVALAIVGICAMVSLQQNSRALQQLTLLEEKTLASWVAENELEKRYLSTDFPTAGLSEDRVILGGLHWNVRTDILDTSDADFKKLKVSVFRERGTPLVTLTGFKGRH